MPYDISYYPLAYLSYLILYVFLLLPPSPTSSALFLLPRPNCS